MSGNTKHPPHPHSSNGRPNADLSAGKARGSKNTQKGSRAGHGKKQTSRAALSYSVHPEYDDAALRIFLEHQGQLFPEKVASTPEEAADFLEMCFAVIARSKKEVRSYFEEAGTDVEGEDLFSAAEVFPIGDGRYLIVEG